LHRERAWRGWSVFVKYPRTPHLAGSRLQPGDSDADQIPLASLAGGRLHIEEKVDGSNVGISFDEEGLRLQSRGHYLSGGPRERQFARLKAWASEREAELFAALGRDKILFGEWCFAVHSVFYDALPDYLLEFDVYDRRRGVFLGTPERRALLASVRLHAVPVLAEIDLEGGERLDARGLSGLVRDSLFKSVDWVANFEQAARKAGVPAEALARDYDDERRAEGLYVKHEAGGVVVGRSKWVRPSFVQRIIEGGVHWSQRPMIVNQLAQEG
jgi:hypothetical protein